MASSIYYPRTVSSSREIARNACPTGMTSDEFERKFLSANWRSAGQHRLCPPNRPVVVPTAEQGDNVDIAPLMACSPEQQKTLSHLSQHAGGAAVMGLAGFLWDTKIPGMVGDLVIPPFLTGFKSRP